MKNKRSVGVLLFPGFELLDVFGPLEMYGQAPEHFEIQLVSEHGGEVASAQGPRSVADLAFCDAKSFDIVLVPGGIGTRAEVSNDVLLQWIRDHAQTSEYLTSVCTGSALLAKAGILDGVRATTNKKAFDWATAQGERVHWVKEARWVEDGRFFTSSGVSAGIDMTLALIQKMLGQEMANSIATLAEYEWQSDAGRDPFARIYGHV
ncbi:DJ-1/PfpI family protein [Marinobacter sp. S0848L]|uniref:DJ-1/PfpI family protein n=1 Tax=Marinobacter sp. S0848L TaxID=2926423 RepID=UPI001FF0E2C4|nr:DJ-1/PfpI family protein [Marinobacter sp. S0848L]MCK0105257.1 DJ-1/PfpI family protein [Marinobacter sp. S0848L]